MIYCVEDDTSIRNLMVYTLNTSGLAAKGMADGEALRRAMAEEKPELILLDVMLPGEDGISILKALRRKDAGMPIILATAKGTEFDKVQGLDLGADDYLVKPFGMMEMVSRVRAVLRRAAPKAPAELTCGELTMNLQSHLVTVQGQSVQLTLKEYELLRLMMENRGVVFTRDQLLSAVWDTNYVGETRTVDVHIGTLHTKLGKCGEYIQTVRGVGYRL